MAFITNAEAQSDSQRVYLLNELIGTDIRESNQLFCDTRGVQWIATGHGLYCLMHNQLVRFSSESDSPVILPSDEIEAIAEDENQYLWIATTKGLAILNPDRSALVTTCLIKTSWELNPDNIKLLVSSSDKKKIYLLCENNLFCRTGSETKKIASFPTSFFKYDLFLDEYNRLVILRPRNSIPGFPYILNLENYQIALLKIYHKGLKKNVASDCFIGDIYKIGHKKGIFIKIEDQNYWPKFNPTELRYEINDSPAYYLDSVVPSLNVLRKRFKQWQSYFFHTIYIDGSGATWGRMFQNLFIIPPGPSTPFKNFSFTKGYSTRYMFAVKDALYISTYEGLFKIGLADGKHQFHNSIKTIRNVINTGDDVRYWVMQEDMEGMDKIDLGTLKYTREDIPDFQGSILSSICKDSLLWFVSAQYRLYCMHIRTGTLIDSLVIDIPAIGGINSLAFQGDILWGGSKYGLVCFKISPQNKATQIKVPVPIDQVIGPKPVQVIYKDTKNILWIGTLGYGMYRVHLETNSIIHINTQAGLSDNWVYSITSSNADSVLWIGTRIGLNRLDVNSLNNQVFTTEHGLIGNEFNTTSSCIDENNNIYLGGLNGVSYFHPDSIISFSASVNPFPVIMIERGLGLQPAYIFPTPDQTISISPKQSGIKIQFLNKNYIPGEKVIYRYKIIGLTNEWIYSSAGNEILLGKTIPGIYQLLIEARHTDSDWGLGFSCYINFKPTFSQTIWFKILLFAIFAIIVLIFAYLKISDNNDRYKLRQSLVDDLHDSLGGRIFVIKEFVNRLKQQKNEPEERDTIVGNLENAVFDVFQMIRTYMWAFNPQNSNTENLVDWVETFGLNYIKPVAQSFKLQITQDRNVKTNPVKVHHLLMTLQELLTNMIKHTITPSIDMTIQLNQNKINIVIENRHKGDSKKIKPINLNIYKFGQKSLARRLSLLETQVHQTESEHFQRIEIVANIK